MYALLNKASSILVFALLLVLVATAGVALAAAAYGAPPVGSAHPALSLTATPSSVRSDQSTKVTAHIGIRGAALQLSRRYAGDVEFTWLRTLTSDADGAASWEPRSRRTVAYRVEFAGDATYAAAGAETTVSVRPRVALTTYSAGTVFTGDRVSVSVKVSPARPGGTIELEQWDGVAGEWRALQSLTLGGGSRAQWMWRPEVTGRQKLRARIAADADHAAAVSGVRTLEVFDASNPYGVPSTYPHLILVDRSQYKLYYYERGRVVKVFDCVLGRPSLPTPLGHYKIYAKDAHMYGPYGPRRMRYLGAYAIHGTNEPWLLSRSPRNYSHGCTRLSNPHILWLFDRVHVGTPVWNVP
ncbi:MAG: L,D-transpeptidase [Actinobacteria bacterium]|nr:L,D-transpeptidase [Actinomycetota bacterium]